MPRNRHSNPRDPDCVVNGCRNITSRHGVCERHWRELPQVIRMDAMMRMFAAQHAAALETRRLVLEHYGLTEDELERHRQQHLAGLTAGAASA